MLRQILRYNPHRNLIKPKNRRFFNNFAKLLPIKRNNLNITSIAKLQRFQQRHLQISTKLYKKWFSDTENQYAYEILPKLPEIGPTITVAKPVDNWSDFDRVLAHNYRQSDIAEIVTTFKAVQQFTIDNNVSLSDPRFDQLVDGLMDNCEYLNDQQLYELLAIVSEYPPCDTIKSHNFHDIWCCLDDMCCWRLSKWRFEQMFRYVVLWYDLNLGRLCDFTFEVIDRCVRRIKHLNNNEMLYLFFCYNICRRQPVDFVVEDKLEQIVNDFGVDELAVIAMGYFKTQSKIRLDTILRAMIDRICDNSTTINDITLTAILKVIRLSQHLHVVDDLDRMLDRLEPEIGRLSPMTCLHLSLIGSRVQYKHDRTLESTTLKLLNDLENVRVKDIERMLLANVTFNTNPADLYDRIVDELQKSERHREMSQYTNCLPTILHYLSYRNIYLYDLMDRILDDDYLTDLYGKSSKSTPLTIFSLDRSIDVECRDYNGNRLLPYRRYKAAKWYTEYPPRIDQTRRYSNADKHFLDCYKTVETLLDSPNLLRVDHILPHFSKADIVVCKHRKTGEFVEPFGFYYILGDIEYPQNLAEYQWYSIVPLVQNLTVRKTGAPLGAVHMKVRQLETIGYRPILVPWYDFAVMDLDAKLQFFKTHLY